MSRLLRQSVFTLGCLVVLGAATAVSITRAATQTRRRRSRT